MNREPICFKVPRKQEETIRVEYWDLPYFYEQIHFHEEIQITYIIESSGMLLVGDKLDRFRKGEIYIIGKNLPHVFHNDERYYESDSEYRAKGISIFFSKDAILDIINRIPESIHLRKLLHNTDFGIKLERDITMKVIPFMKKMLDIKSFARVTELLNILDLVAFSGQTEFIASRPPLMINQEENEKLNKVFNYIFKNFRERISLRKVSEIACMTPTSFSRYFKQRTQKTFSGFLTEVRISNACKLLSDGSHNVSEACYLSGYNNISNFHRHFLNITGMTPNHYRKKVMLAGKYPTLAKSYPD